MPPTSTALSPFGTRRAPSQPDHEPGAPEHRRQIVELGFIGTMGMKREAAEALYESQLAQWKAEKNGTGS